MATYPNGDVYDGEFLQGVRHGKGKYTYGQGENPDRYEGKYFINLLFFNDKFIHVRIMGEERKEWYWKNVLLKRW